MQLVRIRLVLLGALVGLTWAASLRGFMMVLAGLDSTFTYTGTFGIILPTGTIVGAMLGWAEYLRRTGQQYRLLILTPLMLAVIPTAATASLDSSPIVLAVVAMIGGYAFSGRGPLWARIAAGTINLAAVVVVFLAPRPADLSLGYATAHGAWFDTLGSTLYLTLAVACAIPMRRPSSSVCTSTNAAGAPSG